MMYLHLLSPLARRMNCEDCWFVLSDKVKILHDVFNIADSRFFSKTVQQILLRLILPAVLIFTVWLASNGSETFYG